MSKGLYCLLNWKKKKKTISGQFQSNNYRRYLLSLLDTSTSIKSGGVILQNCAVIACCIHVNVTNTAFFKRTKYQGYYQIIY